MNKASKPNRRRWLRFSLRTFLLLLTALCVWMGIVVVNAGRQKRAIDSISAAGGTVYFDYEQLAPDQDYLLIKPNAEVPGPAWLRGIVGDEFFRSPVGVRLSGAEATDESVEKCARGIPDLQFLEIHQANITDAALAHVVQFHRLRYLGLDGERLTVDGLRQLRPLKSLRYITSFHDTTNMPIVLKDLSSPTYIEMIDTPVSDFADYLSDRHRLSIKVDPNIARRAKSIGITATVNGNTDFRTALSRHV
jgi:hypothetical protein